MIRYYNILVAAWLLSPRFVILAPSLNQIQVVRAGEYSVKQDGMEKYQYHSGGTGGRVLHKDGIFWSNLFSNLGGTQKRTRFRFQFGLFKSKNSTTWYSYRAVK